MNMWLDVWYGFRKNHAVPVPKVVLTCETYLFNNQNSNIETPFFGPKNTYAMKMPHIVGSNQSLLRAGHQGMYITLEIRLANRYDDNITVKVTLISGINSSRVDSIYSILAT